MIKRSYCRITRRIFRYLIKLHSPIKCYNPDFCRFIREIFKHLPDARHHLRKKARNHRRMAYIDHENMAQKRWIVPFQVLILYGEIVGAELELWPVQFIGSLTVLVEGGLVGGGDRRSVETDVALGFCAVV